VNAEPRLSQPDGPVDPTAAASPIEEVRPGRFTLMAAGWMPPTRLVTSDQVLDILSWQRKEIAHRLLGLALDADQHDRARLEGA
jgi:hypothetical protein